MCYERRKINKNFLEKVISFHVSFPRIQKAGEDAWWMTDQKVKVNTYKWVLTVFPIKKWFTG